MFSKSDIARYYDLSEVHYRLFWNLEQSRSLHYGYWDSTTKNFHEALLNINKVLSNYAGITKDSKVLDAGCGIGGSSIWMAKNIGCKVMGISLTAKQVAQANQIATNEGMQHLANFEVQDYTATTYPDASFDVIWGIESICHAPDKKDFIKEAYRLLKPGGRLIVADFYKQENLTGKDADQIQRWANGWAIDDYATKESFRDHLNETGFSITRFEDATKAIVPSAKRLYRSYFLGWLPAKMYRVLHPNATSFGKNNVDTAYLQYVTLKRGLWQYMIILAEKK